MMKEMMRHRVHEEKSNMRNKESETEEGENSIDNLATQKSTNSIVNAQTCQVRNNATKCFWFASLAGLFGALSGLNGKLAVASTNLLEYVVSSLIKLMLSGRLQHNRTLQTHKNEIALYISWISRLVFLISNVLCTGLMWRYYIKSLAFGPTAVCQIVNTGVNFAVSAFAGLLLFNEEITMMWACGAMLVVIGLSIVVADSSTTSPISSAVSSLRKVD